MELTNEYLGSILVFDVTECNYLQQGDQGDISSYTLDELIEELNA